VQQAVVSKASSLISRATMLVVFSKSKKGQQEKERKREKKKRKEKEKEKEKEEKENVKKEKGKEKEKFKAKEKDDNSSFSIPRSALASSASEYLSYVFFGGKVSGSNTYGIGCWRAVGEEVGVKRGIHERYLQSLIAVSDEEVWSVGGDGVRVWRCSPQSGTFNRKIGAWKTEARALQTLLTSKTFETIAKNWEEKQKNSKTIWAELIPLHRSLTKQQLKLTEGEEKENVWIGSKKSSGVVLEGEMYPEVQCSISYADGIATLHGGKWKTTFLKQNNNVIELRNPEKRVVKSGDQILFFSDKEYGYRIQLVDVPPQTNLSFSKLCIPNDVFVVGAKIGKNIWLSSSMEGSFYILPPQGNLITNDKLPNYSLFSLSPFLSPLKPHQQVISHIIQVTSLSPSREVVVVAVRDIILILHKNNKKNFKNDDFAKNWACYRMTVPDGVVSGLVEVKSLGEVWVWVRGGKILRLHLGYVFQTEEKEGEAGKEKEEEKEKEKEKEIFHNVGWEEKWWSRLEVGKEVTAIAEVEEGVVWVGISDGNIGSYSKRPLQPPVHPDMNVRWLETHVSSFAVSHILKVGEGYVWAWWKDGTCVIWQ